MGDIEPKLLFGAAGMLLLGGTFSTEGISHPGVKFPAPSREQGQPRGSSWGQPKFCIARPILEIY